MEVWRCTGGGCIHNQSGTERPLLYLLIGNNGLTIWMITGGSRGSLRGIQRFTEGDPEVY